MSEKLPEGITVSNMPTALYWGSVGMVNGSPSPPCLHKYNWPGAKLIKVEIHPTGTGERLEGLEKALRMCNLNHDGEWCGCTLRNRNEKIESHGNLCGIVRRALTDTGKRGKG